ncbi:hypothetical protein EVAR_66213_1 [Eumeta japonica]|uniref:Uncharacterized protein n=1 Tax=Eumeta variegata TaxID=151549 RepID=A0A4C1ZL15_EUMVA|nr:hypothetical protein EVAR_66213_1 [Eumeta japonica]
MRQSVTFHMANEVCLARFPPLFSPCERDGEGGENPIMGRPCARAHEKVTPEALGAHRFGTVRDEWGPYSYSIAILLTISFPLTVRSSADLTGHSVVFYKNDAKEVAL